ncbi:MAG: hypothetical protein WA151_07170, partial [Desulfatirhabdiaceae bacterium]
MTTVAFPAKKLTLNIGLIEMNEEKAPHFSGYIHHKMEIFARVYVRRNPPMFKTCKLSEVVDKFSQIKRMQLHIQINSI